MQIQTRSIGNNEVVISNADLQKLVEAARQIAPVEIETTDFNTNDLMRLAENGGALDFLHDEREDIYSIDDLKVRYR